MQQQTIEVLDRRPEVIDTHPTGPILVHRSDIASIIKALLLVAPSRDFTAGVIAVATALDVQVRQQ